MIIGNDTGAFSDEMGEDFGNRFVLRTEQQFMEKMQAFSENPSNGFFLADSSFIQSYSLEVVYQSFKRKLLC
jgi:hypothetical protein